MRHPTYHYRTESPARLPEDFRCRPHQNVTPDGEKVNLPMLAMVLIT